MAGASLAAAEEELREATKAESASREECFAEIGALQAELDEAKRSLDELKVLREAQDVAAKAARAEKELTRAAAIVSAKEAKAADEAAASSEWDCVDVIIEPSLEGGRLLAVEEVRVVVVDEAGLGERADPDALLGPRVVFLRLHLDQAAARHAAYSTAQRANMTDGAQRAARGG